MNSKQQRLDELKATIMKQNVCPDLKASATQLVFGDGNPDADVVFIGEAPGKNEDLQGLPFVGAAGRFLNEMLEQIGLKRSDVYITNIVKYRPPNNRDPLPAEKQAFLPYLFRQLQILGPKLIVTLGRHSMEALLPPEAKISQVHGQPKRIKLQLPDKSEATWIILPLFHPAAALYNGGLRATLIEDFAAIPATLQQI
jgi:uracil-DNA glycosylase family 4